MKQLLMLGAFILLSACGTAPSASVESSWKNKQSSTTMNSLNKVVVVAMTSDNTIRRQLEDAFASRLGSKATPSYAFFNSPIQQVNVNTAAQKLTASGYDGAIVLRLENHSKSGSKRKSSLYVTPSLYTNFHGNLSGGVGVGISPGYNTLKDQYSISTTVYDLPQEDLLWSGSSLITNPDNVGEMASDMAGKIYSQMSKDGFMN